MAGRGDVPRPRGREQVRELLRQQSRVQWGSILIVWVLSMGVFWLLSRAVLQIFDLAPLLLIATVVVGIEAWRQHRRSRRLRPALDADPVLVRITDLGPRLVTVGGPQGAVRLPVSSTSGLDVGDQIWAAPPPVPGTQIVLVRHEARPGPGSIDLILPRGAAERA